MNKKILTVTGMSCDHCVNHVKTALEGIDGVADADVSLDDARATVTAQESVSDITLTEAVKASGYDAHVV